MSIQNFLLTAALKRGLKANMQLSPEQRFRRTRKFLARDVAKIPTSISVKSDLVSAVPVEWVQPVSMGENSGASICIYFHGGAFTMGGVNSHRQMAVYLAKAANIKLLVVDYRLAPEHPFPAAAEDAMAIYRSLLRQGIDASRIAMAGDSAGGNLALLTMQTIRDEGLPLPQACVLFSPWLDLRHCSEAFSQNASSDAMLNRTILDESAAMYAPDMARDHEKLSPLLASVAGLPPCLILASKIEVLIEDSRRLQQNIIAAGGVSELREWRRAPHAFPVLCQYLPEARKALRVSADFMNRYLA